MLIPARPSIPASVHRSIHLLSTSTRSATMNTLVASTLNSFLFHRVATPQRPVAVRVAKPAPHVAPNPWAAETRPIVFRSEAFAEDLDEDSAR
jgi:hypothetical protein